MLRTDLCDLMQFTVRQDGLVELSEARGANHLQPLVAGRGLFPLDGTNLIVRAAVALQQLSGTSFGVSVVICKQIPMESGLGGGSGNAAVTLRTLNQLWGLGLPERDLHNIAASLGSDINFLLSGCRAAVCRGRGERVEGIRLNGQFHGVLAVPTTGNSTREVFAALQHPGDLRAPAKLVNAFHAGDHQKVAQHCFNRLQEPACDINPEIGRLIRQMNRTSGMSLLTGSGSACFSLAASRKQALWTAAELAGISSARVWTFRC